MTLKSQQISILSFPVILAIGIFLIPVVPDYNQHDLAAQAVEMTWRWFGGHLVTAVAFGLSLFSVSVINQSLQKKIAAPTLYGEAAAALGVFVPIALAVE